jgi:transposase-like protein
MTKSAKHTPGYPPEFRAKAVRLARTSEKPNTQIARDLGMTTETLRKWLKQAHAPIDQAFVAHVLNGTPLPAAQSDDDEMEEADTEELRPLITCPCDCHDEGSGDTLDVMAVISGMATKGER